MLIDVHQFPISLIHHLLIDRHQLRQGPLSPLLERSNFIVHLADVLGKIVRLLLEKRRRLLRLPLSALQILGQKQAGQFVGDLLCQVGRAALIRHGECDRGLRLVLCAFVDNVGADHFYLNLYADPRRTNAAEEVVKRFIKDIEVEVISADVVDKRTQHPTKATIAFTVAYKSNSPDLAQKVANVLTSLFLGQNLKSRERQAQEATSFLQQEADNLSKHIGEMDDKIAAFKQRAKGALPELMAVNQQMMNQADQGIDGHRSAGSQPR